MSVKQWTCLFCNRPVLLNFNLSSRSETLHLDLPNADGYRYLSPLFVVCPAPDCRKTTLYLTLFEATRTEIKDAYGQPKVTWSKAGTLQSWTLIPRSNAKPFPNYVPQAIREDYEEACEIRDASPKASATLARRVLQGMIRDFWKVKKDSLAQEIDALNGKVEPEVWAAMDGVRRVGNIGAHMEKDVNLIIDVEPEEADALIRLIEILVKEWYVNREDRKKALAVVTQIAAAKDAAKKAGTTPPAAAPAVPSDSGKPPTS